MQSAQLTTAACAADEWSQSALLLSSLQEAHSTLLAAMEVLDRLTREPLPNRLSFTNARWRLSAASLARRALWKQCFRYLGPLVDRRTALALEALNRLDLELVGHSAAHIGRWPADAVEREWPAYCKASRAIRSRIMAVIDAEKRLLYPVIRVQGLMSASCLNAAAPAPSQASPVCASDARTRRWSRSAR